MTLLSLKCGPCKPKGKNTIKRKLWAEVPAVNYIFVITDSSVLIRSVQNTCMLIVRLTIGRTFLLTSLPCNMHISIFIYFIQKSIEECHTKYVLRTILFIISREFFFIYVDSICVYVRHIILIQMEKFHFLFAGPNKMRCTVIWFRILRTTTKKRPLNRFLAYNLLPNTRRVNKQTDPACFHSNMRIAASVGVWAIQMWRPNAQHWHTNVRTDDVFVFHSILFWTKVSSGFFSVCSLTTTPPIHMYVLSSLLIF